MPTTVPLGFDPGSWEDLHIEGYVKGPRENMKIYRNVVAPGYFHVLHIPLLAGRDFTEQDDLKSDAGDDRQPDVRAPLLPAGTRSAGRCTAGASGLRWLAW